ncbi:hypothetical protein GCM10027446_13020 [Angustibacter peucedani]
MSTAVSTPVSTAPSPGRVASSGGRVVRPSFVRLTRIELRKAVDYRAGRWVLGVMVALGLVGLVWLVWQTWHAPTSDPISFRDFTDVALLPTAMLLPVLGILAMTGEWTQRTALTTFTLSPRRVPVLLAKLVAAVLLMVAVMVAVIAAAAAATALAGAISGSPVDWTESWKYWVGTFETQALFVLMGAGFGAVIPITGVALTAFFVAPLLFSVIANTVLKSAGPWFDVFSTFDRLGAFRLDGKGWESLTSVTIWVVVPLVAGLWASVRREVK